MPRCRGKRGSSKQSSKKRGWIIPRPMRKRRKLHLRKHDFVRRGKPFNIPLNNTAANFVPYAVVFRLTDLINAAEIVNLFDQYMLTGIRLWINMNVSQPNTALAPATLTGPIMYSLIDRDDATIPVSLDDIREYSATKMIRLRGDRSTTIWLKPSILSRVYDTAVTSGYAPKYNTWVSTESPDLPHYGWKVAFRKPFAVDMGSVEVEPIFYFSVKNMK